jgi:hypothetical protein
MIPDGVVKVTPEVPPIKLANQSIDVTPNTQQIDRVADDGSSSTSNKIDNAVGIAKQLADIAGKFGKTIPGLSTVITTAETISKGVTTVETISTKAKDVASSNNVDSIFKGLLDIAKIGTTVLAPQFAVPLAGIETAYNLVSPLLTNSTENVNNNIDTSTTTQAINNNQVSNNYAGSNKIVVQIVEATKGLIKTEDVTRAMGIVESRLNN